jgi:hypothetical protein
MHLRLRRRDPGNELTASLAQAIAYPNAVRRTVVWQLAKKPIHLPQFVAV